MNSRLGKIKTNILGRPYIILGLVFALLAALPLPWNETVERLSTDLLFSIRGSRQISEDIVLLYIGDEDIRAIGDWPISHDYYGYLLHILTQLNAQVIGLDFLFDTPDQLFPENDRIFSDFMRAHGAVCLPAAVRTSSLLQRPDPSLPAKARYVKRMVGPLEIIKAEAAAIGFSNFGPETSVRQVPLVMGADGAPFYSFGLELARTYFGEPTAVELSSKKLKLLPVK